MNSVADTFYATAGEGGAKVDLRGITRKRRIAGEGDKTDLLAGRKSYVIDYESVARVSTRRHLRVDIICMSPPRNRAVTPQTGAAK